MNLNNMATKNVVTTTKPKRRNSDKRKEKSRNAARSRRGKETEIFYDIAHQLPMPHSLCAQLDKAAIMRLALSYLRVRKLITSDDSTNTSIKQEAIDEDEEEENENGALTMDQIIDGYYQNALEGFVIILSREGDMVYLSDSVSKYLGLKQTDLMGHSIYDYSHPCDHDEIAEHLSTRHLTSPTTCRANKSKNALNGAHQTTPRHHHDFLIRLKCTLTPRGKKVNLKSAVYKVIQFSGHVKTAPSETIMGYRMPPMPCLVMIGTPIHHPANIEIPLDGRTFLTRHSMDMKFTYCDDRIKDMLKYDSKELVGRSFYDFHHAHDYSAIEKWHRDLFAKGQTRTGSYRFLSKHGGYAWVQTESTIIYSNKTNKPQCIVCVNYCLSAIEDDGVVLSVDQKTCNTDKENHGVSPDTGMKLSTEEVLTPIKTDTTDDDKALSMWLASAKDDDDEDDEYNDENEEGTIQEKLISLAPMAGTEEENHLMNLLGKLQCDTPPDDQECKPDSDSPINVPELSTSDDIMFVPFDPFAPFGDDNKLSTIDEDDLGREPPKLDGYYSPPPPNVDVQLPPPVSSCILIGSKDPLLPNSRRTLSTQDRKQELGKVVPDDLEMRAPYIPLEDDFELGCDGLGTPFMMSENTSWVPVDPFGKKNNQSSSPQFPSTPALSPVAPSMVLSPVSTATDTTITEGSLHSPFNGSIPDLQSPHMAINPTSPHQNGTIPPDKRMLVQPIRPTFQFSDGAAQMPIITGGNPGDGGGGGASSTLTSRIRTMLKRKSSSAVSDMPACKARRGGPSGMTIPTLMDPWPPERQFTAQFLTPTHPMGLTSFLLQPQHMISAGVSNSGDNGQFAEVLQAFARNVSAQCPSDGGGGGKTLDGGSDLYQQIKTLDGGSDLYQQIKTLDGGSDLYQQIKDASPKMVRRDSLPLIETRDAEVNAPLYNRGLLQGEELLGALDQSMNKVPSQLDFQKMQQE